jgi:hypothetical protein
MLKVPLLVVKNYFSMSYVLLENRQMKNEIVHILNYSKFEELKVTRP